MCIFLIGSTIKQIPVVIYNIFYRNYPHCEKELIF